MEVDGDGSNVLDAPDLQPSRHSMSLLVLCHLCIGILPAARAMFPIGYYALPLVWALSSIPFAQIMLLSTWIGLGSGKPTFKAGAAFCATAYLAFWSALGSALLGGQSSLIEHVVRHAIFMVLALAVLSATMMVVRRWLGTVRWIPQPIALDVAGETRYSLLTVLAITTVSAFVMGLVRLSRDSVESGASSATFQLMLMGAAFALTLIASIWATLAPGTPRHRIIIVLVLAAILGCALAIGAGNPPAVGGWRMFAGATLVVIVPTMLVGASLMYLRKLGYRLTYDSINHKQAGSPGEGK